MGNCQAIDSATLVIQHPNGRAQKLYSPVSVKQIMAINPGHYVALLLTTTLYSAAPNAAPLRVTRIKLLRPTDTLLLGHVYRLVTSQEVMKGLLAKKQGKTQPKIISSEFEAQVKKSGLENIKEVNERSRKNGAANSKSRGWQPSLKAISEAAS